MRRRIEMIGKQFGSLFVLCESDDSCPRNKEFIVTCINCSTQKTMCGGNIRRAAKSTRGGCVCGERLRLNRKTKKDAWLHPAYKTWDGMMKRCYSEKHVAYRRYGGRGIEVVKEWHDAENFFKWLEENKWVRGANQIDRINNNLGYSPENCRITSAVENMNNRTNNRFIFVDNERMTISQAARKFSIGKTTIRERLNRGWTDHSSVYGKLHNE